MRLSSYFLIATLFVIGCSAKQIGTYATSNLAAANPHIAIDVSGAGVDAQVVDELTRHLKAKLIVGGFDIESPPEDALRLEVNVTLFEPGNAALRMTVGLGAGRGSLLYSARYLAPDGAVLAEMDGQERFTGGEPHFNTEYGQMSTLMGEERVRTVLVQEAAKHIVELGLAKSKPKAEKQERRR